MLNEICCMEILGLNIKCNYTKQSWAYVQNSIACVSSNLIIETKNKIISTADDQAACDFHHKNFKLLVFSDAIVNFIPKHINLFFPGLEGLTIENSQLKEIRKSNLKFFVKLKMLYLNNNKLQTLPGDLFEDNTELKHVNFNGNRLQYIGSDILSPLNKLEVAYFDDNPCIRESVRRHNIASLVEKFVKQCRMTESVRIKFSKAESDVDELNGIIPDLEGELVDKDKEIIRLRRAILSRFQANKIL